MRKTVIARALCLPLLALCLGCTEGGGPHAPLVSSFKVGMEIPTGTGLLSTDRLPFSAEPLSIHLDISAIDTNGDEMTSFNGPLMIEVKPGVLQPEYSRVEMSAGRASKDLEISLAYGITTFWVEDKGYVEVDAFSSACNDGIDNDNDGLTDYPADPGCYNMSDNTEEEGSYAAGNSPWIYFADPTLADMQTTDDPNLSPLTGNQIVSYSTVDYTVLGEEFPVHPLCVTQVSNDGLYVTDVNPVEMERGFNHVFAFNFSRPPEVKKGDLLASVGGAVAEFLGFTELNFPSWQVADEPICAKVRDWYARELGLTLAGCSCEEMGIMPEAKLVTGTMVENPLEMEKMEGGVVMIENVVTAGEFRNCDFNGNGEMDYYAPKEPCIDACDGNGNGAIDPDPDPEDNEQPPRSEGCAAYCGGDKLACPENCSEETCMALCDEEACQERCNEEPLCTELTTYMEYGQWSAAMNCGEGPKINVVTGGVILGYEPEENLGRPMSRIVGTVRHVMYADPEWIVEPRDETDFVETGEDCANGQDDDGDGLVDCDDCECRQDPACS